MFGVLSVAYCRDSAQNGDISFNSVDKNYFRNLFALMRGLFTGHVICNVIVFRDEIFTLIFTLDKRFIN